MGLWGSGFKILELRGYMVWGRRGLKGLGVIMLTGFRVSIEAV